MRKINKIVVRQNDKKLEHIRELYEKIRETEVTPLYQIFSFQIFSELIYHLSTFSLPLLHLELIHRWQRRGSRFEQVQLEKENNRKLPSTQPSSRHSVRRFPEHRDSSLTKHNQFTAPTYCSHF